MGKNNLSTVLYPRYWVWNVGTDTYLFLSFLSGKVRTVVPYLWARIFSADPYPEALFLDIAMGDMTPPNGILNVNYSCLYRYLDICIIYRLPICKDISKYR